MKDNKEPAEDSIVDFIEDEEYYDIRRNKQQVENATWAIYIFATISFIFFIVAFLLDRNPFDWLNVAINIILIAIYFCLGAYSNQKPFTAFIALFCVLGAVFLWNLIMASQLNLKGIIVQIVLVVYISMRLGTAKKVQDFESKHPK